jgi:Ni/Fe-hydrogenase 1 B-type cytochrome subunit
MRNTHYFFMVVVIITLVWRVWYAFFSKTNADWREFAIGKKDLQSMLGVLAYYGYFSNNKPHVAKYNVLQKVSYNLFLYMMIIQAITGLALLRFNIAFINMSPSQLIIGWNLGAWLGSAALALWAVRMVHYVINWAFILMMTIHFYLAATADVPCALDFFGLTELEVHPGGHGHDDEPHDAPHPTPELQPSA